MCLFELKVSLFGLKVTLKSVDIFSKINKVNKYRLKQTRFNSILLCLQSDQNLFRVKSSLFEFICCSCLFIHLAAVDTAMKRLCKHAYIVFNAILQRRHAPESAKASPSLTHGLAMPGT